jgi:hypothetical protein
MTSTIKWGVTQNAQCCFCRVITILNQVQKSDFPQTMHSPDNPSPHTTHKMQPMNTGSNQLKWLSADECNKWIMTNTERSIIQYRSYIFWDITLYSPHKVSRRFGGTNCLCLHSRRINPARNQKADMFLRNVCWLWTDYKALYSREQNSS